MRRDTVSQATAGTIELATGGTMKLIRQLWRRVVASLECPDHKPGCDYCAEVSRAPYRF